jgi:DNA-binding HxlR family transcriptional regulator
VRVTYELTTRGRAFGDVATAIERWGRGLGAEDRPRRPSSARGRRPR